MPPSGPLILSQVIGIRSITCMHAPSATSPRDTARALNPRKHGRFIKTLRKKQTTPCIAVCLWWGLVCHLCEASGARLEATRLLSDGRGRVGLETAGILDVGVRRRRIDSGGKDGGRILADLTGLRHVIALILVRRFEGFGGGIVRAIVGHVRRSGGHVSARRALVSCTGRGSVEAGAVGAAVIASLESASSFVASLLAASSPSQLAFRLPPPRHAHLHPSCAPSTSAIDRPLRSGARWHR
ncbi:hypothetical protein CC85DRAFT_170924 [Cutaneotrichosporon oleaginosum]|uniref:Uncharacterized protein n=1 Tax=Cutaneotrichosporon oleaginosum TaxID=879819 RepID=A0A0J0XVH4_9TREE|nr:uncharacterized protein CC85DRAFT_170924 [Cutaneotrichosporon oleaginosum]KLT45061.1 hypothetical protein CC85DRAFT_170924 [Cutaneotrichosporon oleaginosum]TXT09745.1 hypothetical protein COLE_03679 [Cutaneotrichosporon oleaginosum]